MKKIDLIVTRHPGLITVLEEKGIADTNLCQRTCRRCVGGAFDGGDGDGIDCASSPDVCKFRGTPVLPHATAADICGLNVAGVLPLALAAECASFTEVSLDIPADQRGKELSADQVRQFFTGIRTFRVLESSLRPDLNRPVSELAKIKGVGHATIARLAETWRNELRRLWGCDHA
jgi:hypothetical protein